MKNHQLKTITGSVLASVALVFGGMGTSFADQLDDIHSVNKSRTQTAVKSQSRVDKLNDERLSLLDEYKSVMKINDGLRVYNKQLQTQIAAQEKRLVELDSSIAQATEMKRQITPLMLRMLDGLEQFVKLDVPFHAKERSERLDFIKDAMENPDISDAEKFRQVLEGYTIEAEYGRKLDAYTDIIAIDGADVNVNVLRIGRISLVAQTKDERVTLAWDNTARDWVKLDNSYRNAVRQGIRIARKQATIDIMMLPVAAPENAQ